MPGRMHATHWFLPWILSTTTTLAWRSLTTGGTIIFPLVFCFEDVFPVLWYTFPPAIKYVTDKKHIVCNRASLCVVLLVRTILHESTNHVDLPELV